MRLIEEQMCNSVINKNNWCKDNTSVTVDVNGFCHVYLHGNKIAEIDNNSVTIYDGGWRSLTTKSRLNAIIKGLCAGFACSVYQHQFEWFITDNKFIHKFENGYTFARV